MPPAAVGTNHHDTTDLNQPPVGLDRSGYVQQAGNYTISYNPRTPQEQSRTASQHKWSDVFSNSDIWTYLPLMRSASYVCEAIYKPLQYSMHHMDNKLGGAIYNTHNKFSFHSYPDFEKAPSILNPLDKKNIGKLSRADAYAGVVNKSESALFTLLATICLKKEYENFKQLAAYPIAVEQGKAPEDVTLSDIFHSQNPIIHSEVQRFCGKAVTRIGSGLSFTLGLPAGIIGNSIAILFERSVFSHPKTYDMINSVVGEYSRASAGEEAVAQLTFKLKNIYQQVRIEEKAQPLNRIQMQQLHDTFKKLATDVVAQRIGPSGVLYVFGGGVITPDDPDRTKQNYDYISDVAGGVVGLQREAKHLRDTTGLPGTQIWQAQHVARDVAGQFKSQAPEIAPSAQPNKLLDSVNTLEKGYVATLTRADAMQRRNLAIN